MALRPDAVPEAIRHLLQLAERWGVSGGNELAWPASEAERLEVTEALAGKHRLIEDWLYSFYLNDEYPEEGAALHHLLVFEREECDGPGLREWLEYAAAVAEEEPSTTNLERLWSAYDHTRGTRPPRGARRVWTERLEAAARVLCQVIPRLDPDSPASCPGSTFQLFLRCLKDDHYPSFAALAFVRTALIGESRCWLWRSQAEGRADIVVELLVYKHGGLRMGCTEGLSPERFLVEMNRGAFHL